MSGEATTAPAVDRLSKAWAVPPGFVGWLSATNHRAVGKRYLATAFAFFLAAGLLALLIRVQLALPELDFLSPERYNQVFTTHGTTMMFLFAVPVMEGLGIYLVPLMIGARDMVFPRLNAFGYWVYLIAGITLYASFFAGAAPDGGWFAYTPLSGPGYSPGPGLDVYVTAITFLEVAALVAAIELIVTILKARAPGMSIDRVPVFVWAILVMATMIVFAMPPLILATVMLALDRLVGTHFFHAAAGGDPVLWQHLFWVFGHPEVYIIAVPAFGIISTVIPTFARRPLAGYTLVVLATLAIGFLSFGLWVHHMYTVGLPLLGMNFFAAASMMITIPSGVQIFAWIVTLWRGRLVLTTPLLFAIGFLVLFVAGGLTGVMVASVPFDWQVHDSYFVVAHFHYVLIGGAVLPVFAGFYYWFPKITGRMLSERLGRWNFWLMVVGFNVAFFPMHQLGLEGMPRRVYTYLHEMGWGGLNLVSTIGAFVLALGVLVFVWNVALALVVGERAPANPWGADTLEWAAASPPENYNFRRVPVVRSRHPLWEQEDLEPRDPRTARAVRDLEDAEEERRETLATTILDAEPHGRLDLATPSLWPLWLALAVAIAFIGSMAHPAFVVVGIVLSYVAILGWLWPRREREAT